MNQQDQLKWDLRFLEMAKLISTWSKDPSTQTGAVITSGKRVVSTGFNGFPGAMPDLTENYNNREEKYSRIVHCEMNALLFAKEPVNGYTLYTYPFISCDRCFVHMLQAGLIRFVAPKPTESQLVRWGESFRKVREYALESRVQLIELDMPVLIDNSPN
jgi:dCMP deaminase